MLYSLLVFRVGQMSINQAAIHYNLPYSSLYGRFKRFKYDGDINGPLDISAQHNIQDSHGTHNVSYHINTETIEGHVGYRVV